MKFFAKYGIWMSLVIAVCIGFYMYFAGRHSGDQIGLTGGAFYFVSAYFIGAVPFGVLIAQLFGLGDVRAIGSGNIGATNVLRTGNKTAAALTLLCDGLKGFVPVALAGYVHAEFAGFALLGALIGHCFPIWLKFKGGKGVATYLGTLFALAWPLGAIACSIWLAMALMGRVSSLSALVMVCLMPMIAFLTGYAAAVIWLGLAAILIIYQHRANIARIRSGTEPKIGKK